MTEIENEESSSINQQSEDVACAGKNAENELIDDSQNPFKSDKKPPKRKKLKKQTTDAENEVENKVNDDENCNGIPAPPPSKRQKKRLKKANVTVRDIDKEIERTITYLTKWDTNRDEWKYEKLRQIYIQKHIFDEKIIQNEYCDVAISYLSTSKGHARKVIVESAEAIIKEIENEINDENQEELTASARYERARKILQLMQD